jgi:hypothetical protein
MLEMQPDMCHSMRRRLGAHCGKRADLMSGSHLIGKIIATIEEGLVVVRKCCAHRPLAIVTLYYSYIHHIRCMDIVTQ